MCQVNYYSIYQCAVRSHDAPLLFRAHQFQTERFFYQTRAFPFGLHRIAGRLLSTYPSFRLCQAVVHGLLDGSRSTSL